MPGELAAYAAILMMAAVTLATRLLGAAFMERVSASPRVERFLEALSSSVLAAVVATVVAQGGLREAAAVALAALVMLSVKSAIWAMLAGMGAAALWTALLG